MRAATETRAATAVVYEHMAFTRADILTAVERSPQAVAARDRERWVGLYTADARIEDPVGSRPHRGLDQIDRFYATFVAPRDITFHRDVDIVFGTTVIRDLELEVRMGGATSAALTMRIPAYLRYDVLPTGEGDLKITRLQAFWELPTMVGLFLRGGIRAVPAGAALTGALMRNQGLAGTAGFLDGFRGAGRSGKPHFARFLDDARTGDEVAVRRRLAKGATITCGDDRPMTASELQTRLADVRWRKMIAAGNRIAVAAGGGGDTAVLIADVDAKPFRINRIRYFTEAAHD